MITHSYLKNKTVNQIKVIEVMIQLKVKIMDTLVQINHHLNKYQPQYKE
jgi:hypothetical protein